MKRDLLEEISRSVNKLLKQAQQKIAETINNCLQDNIEMTIEIAQLVCPEFLTTTKNEFGDLPCHIAAALASIKFYPQILAPICAEDLGLQCNIGGKESRLCLLIPDTIGRNALNFTSSPKVFDVIQKHDPPLFCKEYVQKYHLLHDVAAKRHNLNLVKYLCNLDPSF